tara:strand:- start:3595 stop:3768 length:174 start_codon:yes stop_codon:yes gene_type:complete
MDLQEQLDTVEKRSDNAYTVGKVKGMLRLLKSTPTIGITGTFHQIDKIIDELDNIKL